MSISSRSPRSSRITSGMATVTRSRASARQHGLPRIASAPTSSPWPRLPAELLGRIASACESCAALRAMDALDRSLWSTRVERLLGALRCTPTEPLLLHVRHVARRAAPALVSAGAGVHPLLYPYCAPSTPRPAPHVLCRTLSRRLAAPWLQAWCPSSSRASRTGTRCRATACRLGLG